MAITLVQNRTSESSSYSSTTLAFTSNVTSGNLLTCTGAVWNGASTTSIVVTDTVGTTYTVYLGAATGGVPNKPWIAYGIAAGSGANTVTIDPDVAGAYSSQTIAEWSDIDATPLDVNGGNSTGSSTTPSDGITTSATDTVVIGVMTHGGSATIAPDTGGGWTQLGEIESSANCPSATEYQIFSSAGAKTASWTLGGSLSWCAMTASFKQAAAGGGGGTVHRVLLLGIGI